jgi:hypothetical protein
MSVQLKRYSRAHVDASVSIRGRGLFFSRTPDGVWWALRLRARRCTQTDGWDDPPDGGVREPRRPTGPKLAPGAALRFIPPCR